MDLQKGQAGEELRTQHMSVGCKEVLGGREGAVTAERELLG